MLKPFDTQLSGRIIVAIERLVVERMAAESFSSAQSSPAGSGNAGHSRGKRRREVSSGGEAEDDEIEPRVPKSKKRRGNLTLPDRSGLRGITPAQRLNLIREMNLFMTNRSPEDLKNADRSFFYNSVAPVIKCLENHCQRDTAVFLNRFPTFKYSSFKKCCSGGSVCGGT
jgi:hypothetical protein